MRYISIGYPEIKSVSLIRKDLKMLKNLSQLKNVGLLAGGALIGLAGGMTAHKMSKPVQAYDKANEHLEVLNHTELLTKQDSSNVYRAYFDAMIMKDKEKMDSLELDKSVTKNLVKTIEEIDNDLIKLQKEKNNDNT